MTAELLPDEALQSTAENPSWLRALASLFGGSTCLPDETMGTVPSRVNILHRIIVAAICLVVGGLHFVTGESYEGPFPAFVNGYLVDLLLPFAMCLLLGIPQISLLRGRAARFVIVFGVGFVSESLQYFGIPLFGRTFDPLDYVMLAAGTGSAFAFESLVLSRLPGESVP